MISHFTVAVTRIATGGEWPTELGGQPPPRGKGGWVPGGGAPYPQFPGSCKGMWRPDKVKADTNQRGDTIYSDGGENRSVLLCTYRYN